MNSQKDDCSEKEYSQKEEKEDSVNKDRQNPAQTAPKARVPDGGWGWMVVLGATVTHFLLVGTARCLGVIYVALRERYQSTSANTAWVAAIFNTSRTLTAPLCSLLCNKFGCRRVAFCGGLLFSAGMITSAFSTSLLFMVFSFGLLAGFGGVLVFTPCYIMVGEYFDKRKGTAMGLATMGSGLGNVVLAPVIDALLQAYGFFGTMLIMGALTLHICAGALLYRPLVAKRPVLVHNDVTASEQDDAELQQANDENQTTDVVIRTKGDSSCSHNCCHTKCLPGCKRPSESSLLRNTTFIIYCFLMAGMQYAIMGTLVFVPGFAKEMEATKTEGALLLSIYGFVDMGARFLSAFLFDLKPVRKRRRYPYAVVGLLFGASTILIAFMPNYIGLGVAVALNALFEAAFHSQRATILTEFVPASQASLAVGFLIAWQGVGNITGPPFAGFLRDIYGSHSICFVFGGGVFTLSAIIFATRILFLSQNSRVCHCQGSQQ